MEVNEKQPISRKEHLAWCKQRALELLDAGQNNDALMSLMSDLNKHSETRGHTGMELGMRLLAGGLLGTEYEIREFITGFN